jgi:uncharacterized protein
MVSESFEWDETKRQTVWKERQVDIVRVARIFEGVVLEQPDPNDYGLETRVRAIGQVEGEVFVLVYTRRSGAIRLITAWKAGKNARAKYQARISV